MITFISLLRGINVGARNKILMADLKALYESLAFTNVTTYIQSGNVVFKRNAGLSIEEMQEQIETAIRVKYGFGVPVILRTVDEWQKVIAGNPFLINKELNVEKLHVTFLNKTPEEDAVNTIQKYSFPPDEFIIANKEVYLHVPGGYWETKLSNKFFESKLKVSATTRNWKTVNNLFEIATGLC